jgi:hypothetical protein
MLGAAAVLRVQPGHKISHAALAAGSDMLFRLLGGARRPDWAWFEAVLGYDNPRLSQALIEGGMVLARSDYVDAGLETLEWIAAQQTASNGQFRPIGCGSFGKPHNPFPFDQQPLEAQAAIEAAAAAWRADPDPKWQQHALAAWRWFFGANDRGVVLADLASGRCRDGINPRGRTENCGAESILAFQLGHYSLIGLLRGQQDDSSGERFAGEPQWIAEPAAHT